MKARTVFVSLWLTVTLTCWAAATPLFANNTSVVVAVDSIGMTVSDMDRSAAFYSDVLAFKPISDVEVEGCPCLPLVAALSCLVLDFHAVSPPPSDPSQGDADVLSRS